MYITPYLKDQIRAYADGRVPKVDIEHEINRIEALSEKLFRLRINRITSASKLFACASVLGTYLMLLSDPNMRGIDSSILDEIRRLVSSVSARRLAIERRFEDVWINRNEAIQKGQTARSTSSVAAQIEQIRRGDLYVAEHMMTPVRSESAEAVVQRMSLFEDNILASDFAEVCKSLMDSELHEETKVETAYARVIRFRKKTA